MDNGDVKSPLQNPKAVCWIALGILCWSGLDGGLETDGHDPFAVALDPQAGNMNWLSSVGLMQAGHDHGVAEIKHLRRHERRRRGAAASLLLQI